MRDVVYIVKNADRNEELRYSIRSIEQNMPFGRLWVVGKRMPWMSDEVHHLGLYQRSGWKYVNGWKNTMEFLNYKGSDMSDDVVLMNDDFFVVEPVSGVPFTHRGPVAGFLEDWGRKANAPYPKGGITTYYLMRKWGLHRPLCYETHIPMVVNRPAMLDVLERARQHTQVLPLHRRTIYGNVYGVGGELVDDPKVYSAHDPLPEGPFVSSNDHSFIGVVGSQIRELFPEPSRFEQW